MTRPFGDGLAESGGFFLISAPRISELDAVIHKSPRLLAYGSIGETDGESARDALRSPKSALLTASGNQRNLRSTRIHEGRPASLFFDCLPWFPCSSLTVCPGSPGGRAMSDLLEFRLLKYIAMVAETGNFTRAAERLYIAQPSLSEQIKNLEEGLGIEIFDRTGKRVEPTPAGQVLVNYAKDAVQTRNEIVKAARAIHQGEVPPLRLGFSCFAPTSVLEGLQRLYESIFPACPVHLAGGDPVQIIDRLRRRTLDCALLPMPAEGDDLMVLQISSTPLVVCMRADDPLAQLSHIHPAEMADRLKIFRDPESHPSAHKRLLGMLAECGVRPQVSCAAATPADVQWMVHKGFGLALVDEQMKLESSLTMRAVAGVTWTADTAFVHHRDAGHLALPLLARHLRKIGNRKPRKSEQGKSEREPVQLKLLA